MSLIPDPVALTGYAAAFLTTLSFLPQVIKSWAAGGARDLSLAMLVMFVVGVGLWLAYGLVTGDGPLAVANGVTLALGLSLLALKLRDLARTT